MSDRPLRVLMVAAMPFPRAQGSQVYVAGQAATLVAAGHRVTLATFGRGEGAAPEGVSWLRPPPTGWEETRLHPGRALADVALGRAVARQVACGAYDVVHAHNVEAPLLVWRAARRARIPLVYDLHTRMGEELPTYLPSAARSMGAVMGRALDAILPRIADGCVAISRRAEEHLREAGAREVLWLPPAPDAAAWVPGDPARARARWNLGDEDWVLYTGNTDAYQDLDWALQQVAPRAGLRLWVMSGDLPGPWVARAAALGLGPARFRFTQSRDFSDTRDALAAAAVGLIPRRVCAGFPMKLLNHLAAGNPTVIARGAAQGLGGCEEVPPEELGATLEALMADRARRKHLAGEAISAARALSRGAAPLEAFYRRLIAAKG